jgi:WD40 repeat protein
VTECPQGIALFDGNDASQIGGLLAGERHQGSVTSLVFDADGKLLASGGNDGILMWDVGAGAQHGGRLSLGSVVRGLAFGTHNGQELLAAADDDRQITFWNASSGQPAALQQPDPADAGLRSLAFSPDGQLLAAGTVDGRILVWNVDHHNLAAPPFTGQVGQVRLLGFTTYAGMRLLASVDQENRITVWDVDAARPLAFPPNHGDDLVTGVDFGTDPTSGRLVLVTHYVQTDESWTLQLDADDATLSDRVCTIVWRNLSDAEQQRYSQQELPFPSSLLETWLSVTPRPCPELAPAT